MARATVTREPTTSSTRWRSAFAPGEVIQRVRPKEFAGWLPNPHRGTTTFQRFNGDALNPGLSWSDKDGPTVFKRFAGNLSNPSYPDTTISYCRWVWAAIEPKRGRFRWEVIDGALAAARARGQTLQLRLQPYAGDSGLPDWFWEAGGRPDRAVAGWNDDRDRARWEPDHNHASYLRQWGALIAAFGRRYDGHPLIESVDIAYAGSCGECGGNATPATARALVERYRRALRRTRLISMLGTDGCRHGARYPDLGWRHDCFGDMSAYGHGVVPEGLAWNSMYEDIPRGIQGCRVADRWKTAPVVFETCWTVGYWEKQGWDIDFILAQGLKWHASVFMPKSSFIPDAWRDRIDAFDRRLGYRHVLRQLTLPLEAKPGSRCAFWLWLENVGVAPLYRDYALALRLRQGRGSTVLPLDLDLRAVLPGDAMLTGSFVLPRALRRGEVEVQIGIVDRRTREPVAELAIEPRGPDRWHPLTRIDVL
ncbi:MAG TPA: DUF4832 domain-containing protein [Planctomycetota bacterium]|nr:DUF4832 domain-containing protein [Planctomycetota bacterium]